MHNINDLINSCNQVLSNIKKEKPADVIHARFMEFGYVRVGIELNTNRYWPVKEGQVINNIIIPEDGVVSKPTSTNRGFRYIKNGFYE